MADRKVLVGTPRIDGVGEPAHENWQGAGVDRLVDPNGNPIVAGATGFRIISTMIVQAIGVWWGPGGWNFVDRWIEYNLITGAVTADGTGQIGNAFYQRLVYDPSATDISGFSWISALKRAAYWMGRTGDDIRGSWDCWIEQIGLTSIRVHLRWSYAIHDHTPGFTEQGIVHILLP